MKNIKNIIIVGVSLSLITNLSCSNPKNNDKIVDEQGNVEKMKQESLPFPTQTGFDVPYLQKNFWRLEYSSAGPDLTYKLVVPVNMKPTNVKPTVIENLGLALIGEYQSVDETTSHMEVQVAYAKVDDTSVSAQKWFEDKIKQMQGTLIQESVIAVSKMEGYNALFTRTLKSGEQFVSRSSVVIHKGNYVVVTAMSSKSDYEKLATTMLHTITNLSFVNE